MTKVFNYSRHDLTKDQMELLRMAFGNVEVSKPLNPFFKNGEHLKSEINEKVVSLVAPFNLFFDALLGGLTSTIISWHADAEARRKGYFATSKCSIYTIKNGALVKKEDIELNHAPGEAIDFKTGEKRDYKEVVG